MKLIAGIIFLLAASNNSFACSCVDNSIEQLRDMADTVFSARVTAAKLVDGEMEIPGSRNEFIEVQYSLDEIFKGNPSKQGQVYSAFYASGNCSIPIIVSESYVFFTDSEGRIGLCDGSWQLGPKINDGTLGKLRALKAESQ